MKKSCKEERTSFDTVNFIISYEGDDDMSTNEIIMGFQHLINSGMVWHLQGHYGKMADELIRHGLCTMPTE